MKSLLLIISLFLGGITQATTYYISPTGNDNTGTGTITNPWKTLFKATSTVLTFGDIIHITAGTYTETQTCNLRPGVSIVGDGIATTIVRSSVSGQWSSFLELQSNNGTNGNQSISFCTFDGQYVSEANNKTWMGIWITGRSNVVIHDMMIINFRDRGVIFAGNSANNPLSDPGNYATGNKFYNNTVLNSAAGTGGYGAGLINIGSQIGMEIYNNTMIQDQRVAFKNGWPIKYWENGWLKGCKIYNNTLKKAYYQGDYPGENGDWDFAIELFNIQGLEIYNNNIQGCIDLNYNYKGTYPFSVWIHNNILDHPVINTKFESGIILEFATQTAIIEDNIINNTSTGIQFNTRGPGNSGGYTYPPPPGGYSALTDNIIRRNLFSNVYTPSVGSSGVGIGIFSEGTDDPYINNLYIYNNTIVAKAGSAPWYGLDFSSQPNGDVSNVFIRNNIVNGFQGAWIIGTNGAGNTNINGMTLTHNDAFGNGSNTPSWPGGNPTNYTYNNNLSVNPLFTGSGYFTLQATSPCIDKGVDIGLSYNGAAPDIGFAEFGSAGNNPPTANAGPDQTITLPTATVTLTGSGTDPDGNIVGYLWTKISGPTAGTITSPGSATSTVTGLVQGVYRFELRVTDNGGAIGRDTMQVTVNASSNIPPTANAGPDQNIALPTSTVTLTGSGTDPDGNIAGYLWTKISGPAAGTITNPNAATSTVTGLVQGTYRFELRVTDNGGAFGRDTMQVVVNAASNIPPTANAGPDQNITLPTSTVTLTGSGTDPDGNIAGYLWTKISGPAAGTITNPNAATSTVTGLVQGTYRFELRVTDNGGAFGRDTMQVVVNAASNIPPTANAGPDQNITLPVNSIIVSGSGTDPDGNIVAYQWTKVAGPAAGTITNPNTAATSITGLVQGTYRFELRVTDNSGAFGRDTMQVIVNPTGSNIPPTANAGPDQSIILPANSIILSGSGTDPDGNIVAYLWTKVSGPAAGTITNPNTAATSVTGLVQGTYQFELRVTDNNGAFDRDTMQVIVNPTGTNIPPAANAGPDQTITLPVNSVILSGSGTDPDGNIVAYLWTKISGPAAGTITNPNTAATAVTGLVQGTYRFELRVTDNSGAFGRDTMQVTVNTASNMPPTANAGPDQAITLPVNTVTLSGIGTDPDGTVVAYLWTKISGPAAGTITNPNAPATSVTAMVQGVYRFELRVTDNSGAFGRDTMQVTVGTVQNVPPTANAGPDQTITLPTNSLILAGTGTDPDGTVVAYLWTKISGPAAGTITNPNTPATSVTGLVQGTYRFELRVTDNSGAFGRDTMQVIVDPASSNIPPTAIAGPDQTITLPANIVILSGSGTDPDGTVVAYRWTKVSGPAPGIITNPNTAATSVTGLAQGVYRFELRVTDNSGAYGRDTLQITVDPASSNIPPTANAGPDQNITLPVNITIVSGSGNDPDGNIVAYLWTKISGPAAVITNPGTAATSITGLVQGTYRFELRVTDNNGAFGRDTLQIIVNAAPNVTPTANAGPDQSITLPVNSVSLSGSGTDPDGVIVAYTWRQVSGPSNNVLFSLTTAATFANSLIAGAYQFELTVTDNSGATDKDTVNVVVNDVPLPLVIFNDAEIYPNPVVGLATLQINRIRLTTNPIVIITDLQGKNVYRKELISGQQNFTDKIDFSNMVKGSYFVTVYFDTDTKKTLKVIKQ